MSYKSLWDSPISPADKGSLRPVFSFEWESVQSWREFGFLGLGSDASLPNGSALTGVHALVIVHVQV
jgi:hypothetical protein